MRNEYDFSNAEQGKFYRGKRPFQVVINVPGDTERSRYEVFTDSEGLYHFRLATPSTVLFTSDSSYQSKNDCMEAIASLRHASVVAPTVFA